MNEQHLIQGYGGLDPRPGRTALADLVASYRADHPEGPLPRGLRGTHRCLDCPVRIADTSAASRCRWCQRKAEGR